MPSSAELERFYGNYYEGNDAGVTVGDPRRWARSLDSTLSQYLDPVSDHLRILDYGGGNGSIVNALAERWVSQFRSIEIGVIDLAMAPVTPVNPSISIAPVRSIAAAEGMFDVVIASAILEHLPDPSSTLRELVSRTRPGGVIYVRTPYVAPFLGIVGRIIEVDFTFPAHLHDLGRAFWDDINTWFDSDTFSVVVSRPSPVETSFRDAPMRTIAATLLKLPNRIDRRWPFPGGWEAVLKRLVREGETKP